MPKMGSKTLNAQNNQPQEGIGAASSPPRNECVVSNTELSPIKRQPSTKDHKTRLNTEPYKNIAMVPSPWQSARINIEAAGLTITKKSQQQMATNATLELKRESSDREDSKRKDNSSDKDV